MERFAHGVYLKPKKDRCWVQQANIEEVAKQIAKRDKVRIAPTGVLALYLLR